MQKKNALQKIEEIIYSKVQSFWDFWRDSELVKQFLELVSELSNEPIFAVLSFGMTLRNYFFALKLEKFLRELEQVDPLTRMHIFDKLESDKHQNRMGKTLFVLLDRLESESKAVLLGRIFRAYVAGLIDLMTFQKLSTALERIKEYNLPGLIDFADGEDVSQEVLFDLTYSGLLAPPLSGGWYPATNMNREGYAMTAVGKEFLKVTDLRKAIIDLNWWM